MEIVNHDIKGMLGGETHEIGNRKFIEWEWEAATRYRDSRVFNIQWQAAYEEGGRWE